MQRTRPPRGRRGQLLVPRCSLLAQPPVQHWAPRVTGFSFHFLSPLLLSGALGVLMSAPQEVIWDFIAFHSLGIAPRGPTAPRPPTHGRRLYFSVLSNLSACSAVTHSPSPPLASEARGEGKRNSSYHGFGLFKPCAELRSSKGAP